MRMVRDGDRDRFVVEHHPVNFDTTTIRRTTTTKLI